MIRVLAQFLRDSLSTVFCTASSVYQVDKCLLQGQVAHPQATRTWGRQRCSEPAGLATALRLFPIGQFRSHAHPWSTDCYLAGGVGWGSSEEEQGWPPAQELRGRVKRGKKTSQKEARAGCWAGAPRRGEHGGWGKDYLTRNSSRQSDDVAVGPAGPGGGEEAPRRRCGGWKGRLWGRCLRTEVSETTPCRKPVRLPAPSLHVPQPPAARSALSASRKQGRGRRQGVGGGRRSRGAGNEGSTAEQGSPLPSRAHSLEASAVAGGTSAHSQPPHKPPPGFQARRHPARRPHPLPAHNPAIGFPEMGPLRIGPSPRGHAPSAAQSRGPPLLLELRPAKAGGRLPSCRPPPTTWGL